LFIQDHPLCHRKKLQPQSFFYQLINIHFIPYPLYFLTFAPHYTAS
jgi:hypothetical protein